MSRAPHSELICLFCGSRAAMVRRLIAGPDGCICDKCVALAADEIAAQDAADGLMPRSVDDGVRSKNRLECLKLAAMGLGAGRDELALIRRAVVFTAYVDDGLVPDASGILEHQPDDHER